MDGQTFAAEMALRTPTGWRLTWHGDDYKIAANDENGLVVFASIPSVLLSADLDDDSLMSTVLEATEERIEWCKSWNALRDRAFVSIRPLEAASDPAYVKYTRWIAGEVTGVLSASLESHSTLLPDATLRKLGVNGTILWATAAKNLERWFRCRTWEVNGTPREYVTMHHGPIYLVSDPELKVSSLIVLPRLIEEIAHEMAITPFCFSVPAEGNVLIAGNTADARHALSMVAKNIIRDIRQNAPHLQALSSEVFRIENGSAVSTELLH